MRLRRWCVCCSGGERPSPKRCTNNATTHDAYGMTPPTRRWGSLLCHTRLTVDCSLVGGSAASDGIMTLWWSAGSSRRYVKGKRRRQAVKFETTRETLRTECKDSERNSRRIRSASRNIVQAAFGSKSSVPVVSRQSLGVRLGTVAIAG